MSSNARHLTGALLVALLTGCTATTAEPATSPSNSQTPSAEQSSATEIATRNPAETNPGIELDGWAVQIGRLLRDQRTLFEATDERRFSGEGEVVAIDYSVTRTAETSADAGEIELYLSIRTGQQVCGAYMLRYEAGAEVEPDQVTTIRAYAMVIEPQLIEQPLQANVTSSVTREPVQAVAIARE